MGRYTKIFKQKAYNLFQSRAAVLLAAFIKCEPMSLPISNVRLKPRLYVLWTIDVEGGYIKDNLDRVWMRDEPKATQGFIEGFDIWQKVFNQYNIPATFFVSTQGFYSNADKFKKLIGNAKQKKHEIGFHLHLAEDKILQANLPFAVISNSSKFYTLNQIDTIFSAIRKIIIKYLGEKNNKGMVSFRWGNWGINSLNTFKVLRKYGFMIDSSILPGIGGHKGDDRIYDWSKQRLKDFPKEIHRVLEIPTTTFSIFNKKFHADPVFGQLLKHFISNQISRVKKTHESRVIVILSHSCEIVKQNKKKSYIYSIVEDICFSFKNEKSIKYTTIKKFADLLEKN